MIREQIERATEKARPEIRAHSLRTIQRETAITWAGRACAAAERAWHAPPSNQEHLRMAAYDYAHEALEHSALTGDIELLMAIRDSLARFGVRPWEDD